MILNIVAQHIKGNTKLIKLSFLQGTVRMNDKLTDGSNFDKQIITSFEIMTNQNTTASFELKKMQLGMYLPFLYIVIIWLIKGYEVFNETSLYQLGIYPRSIEGLKGLFFAPLLHSDIKHITGNSISFFILASSLFYFYKGLGYKVFGYIFVFSNMLLWMGGRPSYHIGASMLVYGMAAFLFVSGVIRNYKPLMAVSLVVVFLYGGMVWHVIPFEIDDPISWEGHLAGALTGVCLAFIYRKTGPQRPPWSWEIEEEIEEFDFEEEQTERFPPSNQSHTGSSVFPNL